MRNCPVCQSSERDLMWSMDYKIPDAWPLPSRISWYSCLSCGMLYGDGDFDQVMLDDYYKNYYGYGLGSAENIMRLSMNAVKLEELAQFNHAATIVDFGGAGDDGESIITKELQRRGFVNAYAVGVGDTIPAACDIIFASHVIEHIYDLPETMERLAASLKDDGLLIIDGPDATGILQEWDMPILDFNTKHINHFTLRNYLDLGRAYGFEMVHLNQYRLGGAPAFQLHFKRMDVANESAFHIAIKTSAMIDNLREIAKMGEPVNIWGLGDITWHLLAQVKNLIVANYIDNDPAYRGRLYNGMKVKEMPDNDYPILILAQGQRKLLIENIRKLGCKNQIVEL